ncbi:16S rRNA C1402 (ribose-2'-O) methylase RsmI (RsmI) (PDB:3KWP) (PUBMED:24078611) [Commensalibacter communis]|uniref:Ribosomal RNA small subunit methyltransferase I n=1 Tax=Commensalibacter communis TaxID=2972786 RepID=A0A9W4X6Q8_9PROT|nr:16S rRNA (cytidine(1402)-2'-O)-methyltransferase [Commensalibacter communis]CAI3939205.1 16S rRNA C1402 (ribose-2'-O) methylase RsmI (RsmI) (PDB:3KWP) (PUBMED:24078611) [Commensalibacter communis]CAI3941142.1 16S rRNA C1402 (ribose-2'-O) methylase RsmI (RsmI) (PDB:3KWP) (PUBMED:24078611) [Commensalibacter communis]CAI3944300.1 16S rRNA C1402 (ribose-2'-O) methylase RsmI (RsmI) (PDB:3KWP) (PUBMED:24078611) [Commensalibacter communis]CAI3945515.1 16S rRNA C1402 (ribose-2'-O) methylase RsmI (Rs
MKQEKSMLSDTSLPLTDQQNSKESVKGSGEFILISTPIGNLSDFSLRAKQTLEEADILLCEDTRVTAKLLAAYGISIRMESVHEHNELQRTTQIISMLQQGKIIALVSDAGTPLLSDPGYRLTKAIIEANIPLTAIPGANAALTALTLSGLPPHPYMFVGFPPPKSQARQNGFTTLKAAERAGLKATLIWHEAPHRLVDMLKDLALIFGNDRSAAVARELTKKFEEVQRNTLHELIEHFTNTPPRGEITVLLGPPPDRDEITEDDLDQQLQTALQTLSVKDAASLVATAIHLPKKIVYQRALELSKNK